MEPSAADSTKPMPVITDISQRAIRERNPDDPRQDPKVLAQENGFHDENVVPQTQGRRESRKKGGYGNYASALRKTDEQSDLTRRKEKYAAALEGARIDEDDLDGFYQDTGINPDEPDIMSTVPLGMIKEQYLSTAKDEDRVIPSSEEKPIPHQLHPQSWPPKDDSPRKPQVIDISESEDKPIRDGVDAGHVEAVNILKERWQNLPEKYRNKPLGVNKPGVDIQVDHRWITHFKPTIDEGIAPEDPEWLKMVRHRRWMSTVKARFPEDQKEKIEFERRSTTPRKLKKANPYSVMRSSTDIDSEFDDVMRRRRKHSDAAEEGSYLTKSQTSFLKSASSFRSADDIDFTDSGRPTGASTKHPIKGPIKEYVKNLSLERVRGSMLKWSFSADVVDDPYRFDLPKPIDLLIMDEMERENEWKYEQTRRRFTSDDEGFDGMSIQSSSHASFVYEDDLHEDGGHKLLDESAGFIPKLTDIQKKLHDEVDSKPAMKTSGIEEDSKIVPSIEETKDKYLNPDQDPLIYDTTKKKPFQYEDDERHFEGVKDVKKKLPGDPKPDRKELIMPTTVMKGDKDFKKIMEDRKTAADDSVEDRAESAAQDIQTLASDISKSFGDSAEKSTQSTKDVPSEQEKQEQPQIIDSSIPEKKDVAQEVQPAKDEKQEKPKDVTFVDSPEQASISNLKAFTDHRRKLRPVRKHVHTSNPVKTRRNRQDLRSETDFLVSKSERNYVKEADEVEKPIGSSAGERTSNSKFAASAIDGLSTKLNLNEASTSLRKTAKNVEGISTETKEFGGFLPVMLLQIKGQRNLQTRLVEPSAKSLNSGDAFVLVTHKSVYVWIGKDANIMKKAKAHEVSTIVIKQRDLGTHAKTSHMIEQSKEDTNATAFWKHLGGKTTITAAGDVPLDEEFEKNIQATNVVYRIDYSCDPPELKPRDDLSGRVLSEAFMDPDHAYVLDFGSEVYLWLGRNCNRTARIKGMELTQKVFDNEFKYKSRINPLEPRRLTDKVENHVVPRPSWALLGRMTARSETVLFREKFIDWPDHNIDYTQDFVKKPVSGSFAILSKKKYQESQDTDDKQSYGELANNIFDFKAVDVNLMIEPAPEPSFVLENFNIGRGIGSIDEEGRHFAVASVDVKVWHVREYNYSPLPVEDYGHFHSSEGYVVRWKYCVKRIGVRTLKGEASKKENVGRDKVVFFFWQGTHSTINEKGAAALMTVELDADRGPQVLVTQGKEPPCFPRLFDGKMVVHLGKREPPDDEDDEEETCMFILRNEDPEEAYLLQVKTDPYALRSRTSFVIVDLIELILYVWYGAKSKDHTSKSVRNAGRKLMTWFNEKYPDDTLEYEEVHEGDESELFWDALRGDISHLSLIKDSRKYDFTTRVFRLNSTRGEFVARELLNPTRSTSMTTPYPISQSQLYSVAQPEIFFIDAKHELYMWQGWWPRAEDQVDTQASTTGSAETRFNNDRRLSLQTIKLYAQALKRDLSKTYIVFAGLEPKSFKALFPFWEDYEDVKEINMVARKDKPVLLKVEEELARLSRDTYSLSELQEKPLPEGVDPTRLEMYLHVSVFQEAFGMSKSDFEKVPIWKQLNLKKKAGLF